MPAQESPAGQWSSRCLEARSWSV